MWDYRGIKITYICVSEKFTFVAHIGQIFEISYFLRVKTQGRKRNNKKNPHQTTRSLDLCFLMHLDIAICISDIFC